MATGRLADTVAMDQRRVSIGMKQRPQRRHEEWIPVLPPWGGFGAAAILLGATKGLGWLHGNEVTPVVGAVVDSSAMISCGGERR